jgi:hypothetical protein
MPPKHGFCSIYQMLLLFVETPFISQQQVSLINCNERRWEVYVYGTPRRTPFAILLFSFQYYSVARTGTRHSIYGFISISLSLLSVQNLNC